SRARSGPAGGTSTPARSSRPYQARYTHAGTLASLPCLQVPRYLPRILLQGIDGAARNPYSTGMDTRRQEMGNRYLGEYKGTRIWVLADGGIEQMGQDRPIVHEPVALEFKKAFVTWLRRRGVEIREDY